MTGLYTLNPSGGVFFIQIYNPNKNASIEIFNQTGKLDKRVKNISSEEFEIDISSCSSGLYLIGLKNSNGIQSKKIQIK